jgi:hypothetical protein
MQAGQWDTKPRTLVRGKLSHVQRAAALRGQEELLTTVGDVSANVLFSLAVIHGDINIVDTGIQDSVENTLGLAWRERPANASDHAAQLQSTEAKSGYV